MHLLWRPRAGSQASLIKIEHGVVDDFALELDSRVVGCEALAAGSWKGERYAFSRTRGQQLVVRHRDTHSSYREAAVSAVMASRPGASGIPSLVVFAAQTPDAAQDHGFAAPCLVCGPRSKGRSRSSSSHCVSDRRNPASSLSCTQGIQPPPWSCSLDRRGVSVHAAKSGLARCDWRSLVVQSVQPGAGRNSRRSLASSMLCLQLVVGIECTKQTKVGVANGVCFAQSCGGSGRSSLLVRIPTTRKSDAAPMLLANAASKPWNCVCVDISLRYFCCVIFLHVVQLPQDTPCVTGSRFRQRRISAATVWQTTSKSSDTLAAGEDYQGNSSLGRRSLLATESPRSLQSRPCSHVLYATKSHPVCHCTVETKHSQWHVNCLQNCSHCIASYSR